MKLLEFATLTITGFVSCAEFGSYAFVHPVLRLLPATQRITVEKGLLKTFGRVMPIGMTLCVVLGVSTAVDGATALAWSAAAAFIVALATTIVVNVPINIATGRWDPKHPPADWDKTRSRWEHFQGVRSWLLLIGFLLGCAAVTT